MIDLHFWPTPNGHKITMFLEEAGLDYRIVPVTSARANSSGRSSWRSRPTTGCRRSSTMRPPTAASRSRCSSPAPSSSTSPKRPGSSCRPRCGPARPCWNGCSGRWAASARWPARTTTSCSTHRRSCLRHRPLRRRDQPPLRRARPPAARPDVHRRRRLQHRRHGMLSVDRAVEAAAADTSTTSPICTAGSMRSASGRRPSRAYEKGQAVSDRPVVDGRQPGHPVRTDGADDRFRLNAGCPPESREPQDQ